MGDGLMSDACWCDDGMMNQCVLVMRVLDRC